MIEKIIGEELEMNDKIEIYKTAIEALEKQIPYKTTRGVMECKCGKYLYHNEAYCPYCGQRLE